MPPWAQGYWETTGHGTVYAFDNGPGPTVVGHDLGGNVATGIVGTPSGLGYWLLDTSANIYPYGNATSFPLTG